MNDRRPVNPLTDPDSPEVVAALARKCECENPNGETVQPGELCWDTTVRKKDKPRLLKDSPNAGGRIVHLSRTADKPKAEPRKPRTRKPPVRRAPVSAAKPIVVEGKDLRRKT